MFRAVYNVSVRVPKKNISKRIADVFRSAEGPVAEPRVDEGLPPVLSPARPVPIGRFIAVFSTVAVIAFAFFAYRAYRMEVNRVQHAAAGLGGVDGVLNDLEAFDFAGAEQKLSSGQNGLEELLASGTGFSKIFTVLGPMLGGIGSSYGDLTRVTGRSVAIVSALQELQLSWLPSMLGGRGEELLTALRGLEADAAELGNALQDSANTMRSLGDLSPLAPADYLDLQLALGKGKTMLGALITFLSGEERHIAVFFSNPSELRRGGGFLGSYADLTVQNGEVTNIEVHDVNDADREITRNIVPPRELQALVKNWRAADANWFFDFSASAEKTLQFLEASELYTKQNRRFDGALAVTPEVVAELLRALGPVTVASGRTITAENLLFEIQEEVQEKQAAKASAPKAVLAELVPTIRERLLAATGTPLTDIELMRGWFADKDVLAYFRTADLERIAETAGADGKPFAIPAEWMGDYFAVANANVGGGKTDSWIDQEVRFESQIGLGGEVTNHAEVTRRHRGNEATDWWYRLTNENFLTLLTPPGATLLSVSGTVQKTVSPLVAYAKQGYETDADLKALEDTRKDILGIPRVVSWSESGKAVFGSWTRTARGATSVIAFDYVRNLPSAPQDGGTHEFVIERQSGSVGSYHIEVRAPVGFRFKENGLPVFEYETKELPGRLILTLTFEKVL